MNKHNRRYLAHVRQCMNEERKNLAWWREHGPEHDGLTQCEQRLQCWAELVRGCLYD